MVQTVKKLSNQRSDKGSRIYRSETNGFDSRKAKSYDSESCRLVGEIINVCVDESVLNEKGSIDISKLNPITYDPATHNYIALGEIVGKAFFDGKKIK